MPNSILITRPAGQEQPLIAELEQAGWHCVHQPLLCIEPFTEDSGKPFHAMKHHIMNLDHYDVVISVSGNASSLAVDWIDQYWPQVPVGINWYAVGPSSAKAFEPLHIEMAVPENNHSEGLLEMDGLQDLTDKKVLIFRGVGGREHLANTLKQRGADVAYCELYGRNPTQFEPGELAALLTKEQIHYALLTSGEMLQQLADELDEQHLHSLHLIVPSQRVANMAPKLNIQRIYVCDKINGQGILECLNRITHSN